MKMNRQEIIDEIKQRMEYHPGDAPWSCTNCYHNRPCVDREILVAALRYLEEVSAKCNEPQIVPFSTGGITFNFPADAVWSETQTVPFCTWGGATFVPPADEIPEGEPTDYNPDYVGDGTSRDRFGRRVLSIDEWKKRLGPEPNEC